MKLWVKVVIISAIFLLFLYMMDFFVVCIRCGPSTMPVQASKNEGCMQLIRNDCEDTGIVIDIDVNDNGIEGDEGDTLQALFEKYYGCEIGDTRCAKQICSCNI